MANTLMDSYLQQYSHTTADIVSQIAKIPNLSGGEKQQAVNQVEKLFDETKELLEQLEIETRDVPAKDRDRYQARLKSYHAELGKLEKDLKQARVAFSDDARLRDELLGTDDVLQTEDQRARLLDNSERLERSSHRLDQSYKTCLETEQLGTQILDDLNSQRTTIQRARDRLRGTNEHLGKSSRILSGMARRAIQNRVVLIVLAIIILTVIGVGIFLAVRRF
jgi:vesicle transport through interaction with t-SNAREs protein 1